MTLIAINLSKMFALHEPWGCSNNEHNLGPRAAPLTWQCAVEVAESHATWLLSPHKSLLQATAKWMLETGAWEHDAIEEMDANEITAIFVQNVAADLREYTDVDDTTIETFAFDDCVEYGMFSHTIDSLGERLAEVHVGTCAHAARC